MGLRLNGSTSGYTEIDAPATAGNNTLVLPTGNGTNGQYLQTNGSGTLSWSGSLTLGTAQNSTSGTTIDFTSIPSWVKRATVMFNGVSTNGTSLVQVQLGSGSFTTTGYTATSSQANTAVATTSATSGFVTYSGLAAEVRSGHMVFTFVSSNVWISSHIMKVSTTATVFGGGDVSLSGTLDRIRITTVNGTDTFDAGSINIMYEG